MSDFPKAARTADPALEAAGARSEPGRAGESADRASPAAEAGSRTAQRALGERSRVEDIAIVGMAVLLPKAQNLHDYWKNILSARDCLSDVPDDHSWKVSEHYDADPSVPDKTYAKRGGFIDKVPFDPMEWGVTPSALDAIDTSQLLSLIVAREALLDAGIDPEATNWPRERTSVIVGVTGTQELAITLGARLQGPTWRKALLRHGVDEKVADAIVGDIGKHFPEWQEQSFPGLLGNVVAGRIANRLDLGGTNCVVDAACASSFGAIQLAMADLQMGRSDLALSGGVDALNDLFMYMCFSKTPAFSKSGDPKPFDAAADGILIAEGIAITVLKRLSDAERDCDRIYAVIKGIGASSDGKYKSIYAPNGSGQAKALRRAYLDAGFGLETIELIEAHGTGTKAGDTAEMEGLKQVFAPTSREGQYVAMGSVKSQIGHTKSTAGAAGLVKAALALHQRVLPPTAKVTTPNPKMGFDTSALYVNSLARPWIRSRDHKRRAGVSAFGFGGSNFHLALEEHGDADAVVPKSSADVHLFLFGADDKKGLGDALGKAIGPTVAHASREVLKAWKGGAHVLAFVAGTDDDLAKALDAAKALLAKGPGETAGVVYAVPDPDSATVGVVFPGQGSQHVDMARALAVRYATVRSAIDRADDALLRAGRTHLGALIYPTPAFNDPKRAEQQKALTATEWAQPAIGAVSKGMYDLLGKFGVRAAAFAGHSYGELVALCVAGVYDEESLWTLSNARGSAMRDQGTDRGTMAAVSGDLAAIQGVIDGLTDGVVLANRNHPTQGVVSGTREGVKRALSAFKAAGLAGKEIAVSAAFHSALVADAEAPFAAVAETIDFKPTSTPVYANVTANAYGTDPAAMRDTLTRQITRPVDFVGVIDAMWQQGVRTFVECGPKSVLAGLVKVCLKDRPGAVIVSLDDGKTDGDLMFKRALATLATRGVRVDVQLLLAEPLPVLPRQAKSKATVWLAGANFRKPETKSPPPPVRVAPAIAAVAAVAPTAATPRASAPVAPPIAKAVMATPTPTPAKPAPVSAPRGAAPMSKSTSHLSELLETTRASLAAFQSTQERTALVHAEFLKTQAKANDSFTTLFSAHARLVESAAGMPMSAFAERAPAPAMTRPAPVQPTIESSVEQTLGTWYKDGAAEGAGRVLDPAKAKRPAIAAEGDLPPIVIPTHSGEPTVVASAKKAAPAQKSAPAKPAPKAAPVKQGPDVMDAMYAAVAEKTGYPADMLEAGMDLEADLGIDSIKRVEILSNVQERVPSLPELDNDRMSALRTLGEVVAYLREAGGSAVQAAPSAKPAAPTAAARSSVDVEGAMFAAVAEKTGYPADMLESAMDLEADLGIDSIKRVEILSNVQERVPSLPELDNDRMSALRTLGEVVAYLREVGGEATSAPASKAAPIAKPSPKAGADVEGAMFAAVAEKTGYPADMLESGMDLEADLGIDSIKRVEILSNVQERVPSLPELDNDRMSALRTLGEVVAYLREVGGENVSASDTVAATTESTDNEPGDVMAAMYAAVAEKTGYPADMLEPGMDLEADLGIDSIKRVEILSNVQERVPSLPELDNERMSALRTLGEVVGYLRSVSGAPAEREPEALAEVAEAAAAPTRRVIAIVPAPNGEHVGVPSPAVVLGGAYATAIAQALKGAGVEAHASRPEDTDLLALALNGARSVICCAVDEEGTALGEAVRGAFLAAHTGKRAMFATISQQGGKFGFADRTGRVLDGALAGLVKTLAQEWPEARCLALDLAPGTRADAVARELGTARGEVEIGLSPDGVVAVATPEQVLPVVEHSAPVAPGDVVVVSGGARGVTAAVAREMARRWQPHLVLLGRSAVTDDPAWARGIADDGLKGAFMADAKAHGQKPSPRDAEQATQRVLGSREVRRTLQDLRGLGAKADYVATDVRDRAAVASALAPFGAVRGLVHGAGVIADKLVVEKSIESFDLVYGTKVEGLDALLGACDPEALRMVAMFGSVAGRFGNKGQCDYAMGNEVLAKVAADLRCAGIARVRCFDWGPWEAGMVTPALKKQLEARGMALIGLDAGAQAFCDELECASANDPIAAVEVVYGGPEDGPVLPAGDSGRSVQHVNRGRDRYLDDHRIAGKAVVPFAMVLEWFTRAARQAFPALRVSAIRDVAVLKGVVVENGAAELAVEWTASGTGKERSLAFRLVGANGVVHYKATLVMSPDTTTAPRFPGSNGLGKHAYPYAVDEAYRRFLFHGPTLQGIEHVVGISDHGMVAKIRSSLPKHFGDDAAAWLMDPLVVDSALQMMLLWVRETHGTAALPCSIGEFTQHSPFDGTVTVHLEMVKTTPASGRFDASFVDAAGHVVARLTGGEYAASSALLPVFRGDVAALDSK